MNRRSKNLLIFAILIFYIIIFRLFIINGLNEYFELITATFILLLLTFSVFLYGYQKPHNDKVEKNILIITAFCVATCFLAMFGSGIFIGFLSNAYSLTFLKILNNIIGPIVIIIFFEIFRYILISSNKNDKKFLILFAILSSIFEIAISFKVINFRGFANIFYTLFRDITPIVIKNFVLSYLCSKSSFKAPMLYRLVMETYEFILPIIPNISEYINTMIRIILPTAIYMIVIHYINRVEYEMNHSSDRAYEKSSFKLIDIPIYLVLILLVCLVSGLFPHTLMSIGSNSMTPDISKGDVVIIEKLNKKDTLKKGNIIAYRNKNMIIVHRIVEVRKDGKKTIYKTKGDANNSVDDMDIEFEDVKGRVLFKVPFVGYPAVWLKELFN